MSSSPTRKLAAILHADVAGFSRLTAEDEDGTYQRLTEIFRVMADLISARRGRVVNYAGDAILADFATATDALSCSVYIQEWLSRRNQEFPQHRRLIFRIGVNLGELLDDGETVFGSGVNIAARLQAMAEPGGICVSDAVRSAIGERGGIDFEDLGRCEFKNIPEPVWAWRVGASKRESDDPTPREASVLRAEARAYTVLMGEEDEGEMRAVLDRVRNLVVDRVEEYGGRVVESPAEAIVAVFDDEAGCIACARSARDAVALLNEGLKAGERVHYRFGVARGEVVEDDGGVTGAAAVQAAELACVARTDGIRTPETPAGTRAESAEAGKHRVPPQLESLDLPPPQRPSIALLPFTCITEDEEGEAIAEGLRIDITNALMKMSGIFLIAPSTMNHLRGMSAEQVASQVGVRHVLEGSIRRSRDHIRATMQLTDTVKGALVWSESYDRTLDNTFTLQDEITERVVLEMDVKLSMGEQARVWKKCLMHPRARADFYRGLKEFFRTSTESVATAKGLFERVADLVPDSPVGPTWAALCLWLQSTRGWTEDPKETQDQAVYWAERAASMEDADGQAHTVLGAVRLLERRFDEALATARDSVAIRPGCNTANGILANVLLHCGEFDSAVAHVRRAIRIGPVYPPWFLEILSTSYREAGKVGLAITVAREVLRLVPGSVEGRLALASALTRGAWLSEAREVCGEILELDPDFSVDRFLARQPYRSAAVLTRVEEDLREAGLPA